MAGGSAPQSAGIVDSHSARTTGVGGNERGFDPAKKVEGILSAICSLTLKVWCSRPRYTAPKFQTKMASGCSVGPTARSPSTPSFAPVGRRWLPREGHRRWAEEVLGLSVEVVRNRRGICLRGDDAAHGEAVGSCVGVSRQSQKEHFSDVRIQEAAYPRSDRGTGPRQSALEGLLGERGTMETPTLNKRRCATWPTR
jgi:hypothetical protein